LKTFRYLTIRNKGKKDLVVGTLQLSGSDAFSLPPLVNRCSGRTLPPNLSCTTRIDFAPTVTGEQSATLDVPSNDPDHPLAQVSITGQGL